MAGARCRTRMPNAAGFRISRAAVLAINASPAIVLAVLGYSRRWVTEDAFIVFRVVDNLLSGYGPVFNVDERVEAYTNPLWMGVLALWKTLGGSLEAGSVWLGLILSVGGLVVAQSAAYRVLRYPTGADESSPNGIPLPLGAAVFVAIPVVWDFATSGMETGLALAWLGASSWLLARIAAAPEQISAPGEIRQPRAGAWCGTALVLGLGPLIRPDLAVFSAGFSAVLGLAYRLDGNRPPGRPIWVVAALALLLPTGAYEVFRMGYFAALVPNTALAKEAGLAYWSRGWQYAVDFGGTYALWVPLLVLYALGSQNVRAASTRRQWIVLGWVLVPAATAAAHAGYVIRLGGDFMHGRLLLPSLFAGLLPVMTMVVVFSPPPRQRALASATAVLVIVGWSIICAVGLRLPYTGVGPLGVADERDVFVSASRHAHPVRAADYAAWHAAHLPVKFDAAAPRLAAFTLVPASGRKVSPSIYRLPQRVHPEIHSVIDTANIGVSGYTAGPGVHVLDRYGLADPIASHLRLENRDRRAGHEKILPDAWVLARFTEVSATPLRIRMQPDGTRRVDLSSPATGDAAPRRETAAARAALACGDLAELVAAVEEPMSVARFLRNMRLAWRLHRLRIPADAVDAERELCARS